MPAAARSRNRAHAGTTVAPRAPRRVSGPVARRAVPAPAGGAALPRTTSVFARVRALPEHRVVDRLLRSRLWIWALGVLLGGIVTMQVSLLKLNSGISRAVETTTTLERQNADLEASIAKLSAPDRIETGATSLGMVMPPAGDVEYLSQRTGDAARAVERMVPPSDDAAALLANRGIVPGSLAGAGVAAGTAAAAVAPAAQVAPAAPADQAAPSAPVDQAAPTAPTDQAAPSEPVATPVPAVNTDPATVAAAPPVTGQP